VQRTASYGVLTHYSNERLEDKKAVAALRSRCTNNCKARAATADMIRPLRVLIAEDEPTDVALLKRAFAKSDFKPATHFLADGQEVIEFLERGVGLTRNSPESPPNVLLLDLKMPRVDGFQVLQWLREHPPLRNILVVIFSNSEDPEDVQRAYDLGADSYIVKPRDPALFIDALHDMEKFWLRLNATPECGEPSDKLDPAELVLAR
jgi:CheY-like chemotaxis protein